MSLRPEPWYKEPRTISGGGYVLTASAFLMGKTGVRWSVFSEVSVITWHLVLLK